MDEISNVFPQFEKFEHILGSSDLVQLAVKISSILPGTEAEILKSDGTVEQKCKEVNEKISLTNLESVAKFDPNDLSFIKWDNPGKPLEIKIGTNCGNILQNIF